MFFFFKQKTAYEMRISDWSSDVVLFRSDDALQMAVKFTRDHEMNRVARAMLAEQALKSSRMNLVGVPLHADQPFGEFVQARAVGGDVEIGSASCRDRVCPYV